MKTNGPVFVVEASALFGVDFLVTAAALAALVFNVGTMNFDFQI